MASPEADVEIEMFIRNQDLRKKVGGSRTGQREKSNCSEAK